VIRISGSSMNYDIIITVIIGTALHDELAQDFPNCQQRCWDEDGEGGSQVGTSITTFLIVASANVDSASEASSVVAGIHVLRVYIIPAARTLDPGPGFVSIDIKLHAGHHFPANAPSPVGGEGSSFVHLCPNHRNP